MILLDGRKAREHYSSLLQAKIGTLPAQPHLVIFQVGRRPDSDSFIAAKKNFAKKYSIKETHIQLEDTVSQADIMARIEECNKRSDVHGIIVQLPLPSHFDRKAIIGSIDPKKDIDGLTVNTPFVPATARGIRELLDFYDISLKDKKVTVVGQSDLVGKPVAAMCRERGAMVTVCDSRTQDLRKETKSAEILIVAIGKPKFIDESYVSSGQIVIDVGITRYGEELVGDVDRQKVGGIVSMLTPVPGGVGQMTVVALFENLIDAWYNGRT